MTSAYTEAELLAAFDRWWRREGHWAYASRERAMEVWLERGLEGGVPDWPRPRRERR